MQINSGFETGFLPKSVSAQQQALTPSDSDPNGENGEFQLFGEDGLGFFDFLDIINPLQHLPFVGPMYREWTGDELAAGPRMMGSTLYFGPIGLIGSAVDVVLEEITGDDLGGNIMSVLGDGDETRDRDEARADTEIIDAPAETVSVRAGEPTVVGTDAADPVTAWAMAELNYRQAQAEKLGLSIPAKPYSRLLSESFGPSTPPDAPALTELQTNPATGPSQMNLIRPEILPETRPDDVRRANAAYRAASLSQQQPDTEQSDQADRRPGIIADKGGWFTAAMLDALAKSPPKSIVQPDTPNLNGHLSSIN